MLGKQVHSISALNFRLIVGTPTEVAERRAGLLLVNTIKYYPDTCSAIWMRLLLNTIINTMYNCFKGTSKNS